MSDHSYVLLLDSEDPGATSLHKRLLAFGVEAIGCEDLADARQKVEDDPRIIRAVLIPTTVPTRGLKAAVKALRKADPTGALAPVSVGERPDPAMRRALRSARIRLAMWEPIDDTTLRFQLNRALAGGNLDDRRRARAPAHLPARVTTRQRLKHLLLHTLSAGGAFVETPRPNVAGSTVSLQMDLPSGTVSLGARVLYANVPGNLREQRQPVGMALLFDPAPDDVRAAIQTYVATRLAEIDV